MTGLGNTKTSHIRLGINSCRAKPIANSIGYEFDGSTARKEIPELPFEALREAVVNAVVHRDYFEKGANVMVEIFNDRLEISSPGSLPNGLKEADFGKRSVLRNPNIANLMHRIDYIEKMGTGIQRIQKSMKKAGLSPVEYEFTGFVSATFYRDKKIRLENKVGEKLGDRLGDNRIRIMKLMIHQPSISLSALAEDIGISQTAVEKNIEYLKSKGYIRRIGPVKGGHWAVVDDD